jgi:hypothetical protein
MNISYETELYQKMMALRPNKYFKITDRPDKDRFIQVIKEFIDMGCQFQFSEHYTHVKRLSDENEVCLDKFSSLVGINPHISIEVKGKIKIVKHENRVIAIEFGG